jgi:hypothetical protein
MPLDTPANSLRYAFHISGRVDDDDPLRIALCQFSVPQGHTRRKIPFGPRLHAIQFSPETQARAGRFFVHIQKNRHIGDWKTTPFQEALDFLGGDTPSPGLVGQRRIRIAFTDDPSSPIQGRKYL